MTKETSKIDVNKLELLKGRILYDSILVKPIIVENDGVVVKPQQYEDKPEWGLVVITGAGRLTESGTVVPLKVNPGDKVLFQKYSAQKFRHSGTDYLIIREDDIYLAF